MDTQPVPDNKTELLERIHQSRSELEVTIEAIDDAQLVMSPGGGWSVKDHLAHLAAWEQSIVALLQGQPRHKGLGIDEATYLSHDIDVINQSIYELHHDTPIENVLDYFRSSHTELMGIVERMTDDDLQKPYSHFLPNEPGEETGAPIVNWIIGDTYSHYAEHLKTIREITGKD